MQYVPPLPSAASADYIRRVLRASFGVPCPGLRPRHRPLPKREEARLFEVVAKNVGDGFLWHENTTLLCEAIPFGLLPARVAFRNARRSLRSPRAWDSERLRRGFTTVPASLVLLGHPATVGRAAMH